jgi:hypothetical protein
VGQSGETNYYWNKGEARKWDSVSSGKHCYVISKQTTILPYPKPLSTPLSWCPCLNNFSYLWDVYSFSAHQHPDLWYNSCGFTNLKQELLHLLHLFPDVPNDMKWRNCVWDLGNYGVLWVLYMMWRRIREVASFLIQHVVSLEIPNKFRWYLVLRIYIKCFTLIWFRFISASVNHPLPEQQVQQIFCWERCLIRRKS